MTPTCVAAGGTAAHRSDRNRRGERPPLTGGLQHPTARRSSRPRASTGGSRMSPIGGPPRSAWATGATSAPTAPPGVAREAGPGSLGRRPSGAAGVATERGAPGRPSSRRRQPPRPLPRRRRPASRSRAPGPWRRRRGEVGQPRPPPFSLGGTGRLGAGGQPVRIRSSPGGPRGSPAGHAGRASRAGQWTGPTTSVLGITTVDGPRCPGGACTRSTQGTRTTLFVRSRRRTMRDVSRAWASAVACRARTGIPPPDRAATSPHGHRSAAPPSARVLGAVRLSCGGPPGMPPWSHVTERSEGPPCLARIESAVDRHGSVDDRSSCGDKW